MSSSTEKVRSLLLTDRMNLGSTKSSELNALNDDQDHQQLQSNIEKLMTSLPQETLWGRPLRQYNGVWFPEFIFRGVMAAQQLFQVGGSDIILASFPKCGTTWMKALVFSVVNRNHYQPKQNNHPLLSTHPQDLVPVMEIDLFPNGLPQNLPQLSAPRIFSTHIPYAFLPHSISANNCRVVYICRNPLDCVVSAWHFLMSLTNSDNKSSLQPKQAATVDDEFFDKYCRGVQSFGPFWDTMLGYWKASLEKPETVLFMRYEDLKEDPIFELKRLAAFLGFPFSVEEEAQGLVEDIIKLCSMGSLKGLEINQKGIIHSTAPASSYFRKGEVGDYVNHLTPSMVETMNKVVQEKFAGSGLAFRS